MVFETLREFGVSLYALEDGPKNGNYAPSFHIIDHVIYHTSLDVPELVSLLSQATQAEPGADEQEAGADEQQRHDGSRSDHGVVDEPDRHLDGQADQRQHRQEPGDRPRLPFRDPPGPLHGA